MTRVGRKAKGTGVAGGCANGDGAQAPAPSPPMPLTVEHAFRRIADARGLAEGDLFTRVVEAGLVSQAEQGQGWAVKLLLETLTVAPADEEVARPLSPEAGQRIYEILLQERALDR